MLKWSKLCPFLQEAVTVIMVVIIVVFGTLIGTSTAAAGDCMSNTLIDCFECNSWDDPRCHDPFNFSIYKEHMPPIRTCKGCCVKMVQFIGTEHYQVKRTCTDEFDVNFFMVNHACMTEGNRHGRMCFCEEDECNAAVPSRMTSPNFVILVALLILVPTFFIEILCIVSFI